MNTQLGINILSFGFSWLSRVPKVEGTFVNIPPLKGDKLRCSTVLPYLEAYHYENESSREDVYFTEHDLNGMYPLGIG